MSFIKFISPEEADPTLKPIYDEIIEGSGGRLPQVLQCMGLNPDALQAVRKLNSVISFGGSTLGQRREEMIATFVSRMNECDY